jgi:hypothetical protein
MNVWKDKIKKEWHLANGEKPLKKKNMDFARALEHPPPPRCSRRVLEHLPRVLQLLGFKLGPGRLSRYVISLFSVSCILYLCILTQTRGIWGIPHQWRGPHFQTQFSFVLCAKGCSVSNEGIKLLLANLDIHFCIVHLPQIMRPNVSRWYKSVKLKRRCFLEWGLNVRKATYLQITNSLTLSFPCVWQEDDCLFQLLWEVVNGVTQNLICRHLKNWPVKGLCGRCLSECVDWT